MDGRSRLSRGSGEVQTSQWQPMVGTPTLVPEPSTVIFTRPEDGMSFLAGGALGFGDLWLFGVFHHLHVAKAQLSEGVFQHALLCQTEVAPRFFLQDRQQIDTVPC